MYECATVAYIHVTDVLRCFSPQLDSARIQFSFLSLCLIEIAFVVALVAFLTVLSSGFLAAAVFVFIVLVVVVILI